MYPLEGVPVGRHIADDRMGEAVALLLTDTVHSFSITQQHQGLQVGRHPLLTLGWMLIVRVDRQRQMDGLLSAIDTCS